MKLGDRLDHDYLEKFCQPKAVIVVNQRRFSSKTSCLQPWKIVSAGTRFLKQCSVDQTIALSLAIK